MPFLINCFSHLETDKNAILRCIMRKKIHRGRSVLAVRENPVDCICEIAIVTTELSIASKIRRSIVKRKVCVRSDNFQRSVKTQYLDEEQEKKNPQTGAHLPCVTVCGLELAEVIRQIVRFYRMTSKPPIYLRNTSGTVTLPSGF